MSTRGTLGIVLERIGISKWDFVDCRVRHRQFSGSWTTFGSSKESSLPTCPEKLLRKLGIRVVRIARPVRGAPNADALSDEAGDT